MNVEYSRSANDFLFYILEDKQQTIIDQTETNLVTLRRTIYLTIQSSIGAEECAHKLLKMNLRPGQEVCEFSF
jgi:hypothetical protein